LYISTELFPVIDFSDFNFEIVFVKIKVICDIFNREIKLEKSKVMQVRFFRLFIFSLFIIISISAQSQELSKRSSAIASKLDSLKKIGVILREEPKRGEIVLTREQAIKFLEQKNDPRYWSDSKNPLRLALDQLVYEASHPRYDSSKVILDRFPYDSLHIPWDKFYIWEPMRIKIPALPQAKPVILSDSVAVADSLAGKVLTDSLQQISVPVAVSETQDPGMIDTTLMVIIDTIREVKSSSTLFPFAYLEYPYQGDSIKTAVKLLTEYLEARDSSVVYFKGVGNSVTPVWMNTKSDRIMRFWLKNDLSDSVTVWIGNQEKNTVGLYLEQGVSFRRPVKQGNYSDARIDIKSLDNSKLLNVQKIVTKPQYWKYRAEASFVLSQASLTNWVKGGESSISSLLEVTGFADYNNKALKLSSNNFIRLKLGFISSGGNPIRKNADLLETNSKLNHKAFGKFDFSAILLLKTQLARGKNYTVDPPVIVSKFVNPFTITAGFGLDYKPNKTTSFNVSPLSYKGTFVPDTANIDQTKYGVAKDKRSKNEPGASVMLTNEYRPVKNVTITNRLQLFTNYINNPLNIDVDWELNVVANINWFTDVRFNTHLIFDDDTRTVELDKDKKPILRADGTQKKTARVQFKEMLGFSLIFRF
jgi:hypothetical protein